MLCTFICWQFFFVLCTSQCVTVTWTCKWSYCCQLHYYSPPKVNVLMKCAIVRTPSPIQQPYLALGGFKKWWKWVPFSLKWKSEAKWCQIWGALKTASVQMLRQWCWLWTIVKHFQPFAKLQFCFLLNSKRPSAPLADHQLSIWLFLLSTFFASH